MIGRLKVDNAKMAALKKELKPKVGTSVSSRQVRLKNVDMYVYIMYRNISE